MLIAEKKEKKIVKEKKFILYAKKIRLFAFSIDNKINESIIVKSILIALKSSFIERNKSILTINYRFNSPLTTQYHFLRNFR